MTVIDLQREPTQKAFSFGGGISGQVGVWLGVLPFLSMILAAGFMLSGQEQFIEDFGEEE